MEENKVESLDEVTSTPVVESLEPVTEVLASVEPVTEAPTPVVETPVPEPVTEAVPATEPVTPTTEAPAPEPATTAPATVETTPVKEKKGPSKILILLLIVVVIFAIWFFALGGNEMLGLKKAAEEPKQEEKVEEPKNKIETVELTEEEANKLINYVPESTPYAPENDYSAYDSKKVNVSEMNTNWLIYLAMQDVSNRGTCTTEQFNLNGICDFTLNLEDVKASVKDKYGDINIDYPQEITNNFLWRCTLDNDVYVCSNSGGGYAASAAAIYFKLAGTTRTFTKFQKAEKDSNNLYVYVKYAKIEAVFDELNVDTLDASGLTFRIRKYGTGNEVIDENILNGKDFYEESGTPSFYDKVYDQFGDKMTTYKITYKINGDSYNLVSVEPEK